VFLDRELERKAEMKLSEETNEEWERRKAVLMGKRSGVVPLSNIKSYFVSIDSGVLYGIMREIGPKFSVSREDFTGENRETHWKRISDSKRLKVSKQNVFTGKIETDGVALCVHDRRLKTDRPVPPLASPVTRDEENKEEERAIQEVEDNDLVVDVTKDEDKKTADPAMQEVEHNDLVVGVTKDEDKKAADPAMQEVEHNDLVVGVTKDENEKTAGPSMQEVEHNDLVVSVTKDENKKAADPAMQEVEHNDLVVGAVKNEENKKAGSEKQKVQDKDVVVGTDPGSTNTITIAAPKRAEDGTYGNLRQKDIRLLTFSRARFYRESGVINATKKIETWNSGMKEHLEAMSEVTSRGADVRAFRKFMEVRVAH